MGIVLVVFAVSLIFVSFIYCVLVMLLKKRLKNTGTRRGVSFVAAVLFICGLYYFSDQFYFSPMITKKINADFYFYKNEDRGLVKKQGHIFWGQVVNGYAIGSADVILKPQSGSKNTELIITDKANVYLDTILNFDREFDFECYNIEPVKKK